MNVTAVVFGAIFGFLFLLSCVISAVKAVKDRKRIKERIAIKKRKRLEKAAYDNVNQENGILPSASNNDLTNTTNSSNSNSRQRIHSQSSDKTDHSNVYRTVSADDVKLDPKRHGNIDNSSVPNLSTSVPELYGNVRLSPECLSVKKQIRRSSYAIAVDTYSWLPREPPRFAKTQTIVETYRLQPGVTKAYENKAFDPHDIKQ